MSTVNTSKSFTTPVGRLVWGSLSKAKTKDAEGNPLVIKNGPDAGKTTQRFEFGLAIPKGPETHWNQTPWGMLIDQAAKEAFPQGQHAIPSFAWKVQDGDSKIPNRKGRIPSTQEGFKGHWILAFSSSFAPTTVNKDGTQPFPADSIKNGHYVQVNGSVGGNKSLQQPGVFLNHRFVAHAGYGPEIQSGPDASQAGFGKDALPAGASSTPVATLAAGPTNAAPAAPQTVISPAPTATPATFAPPPPVTQVVPHPTFLTPTVTPPPPSGPVMTEKAGTITYAQMIANGWTHEQLVEHKYIRAA
jgi:hypothetical protein